MTVLRLVAGMLLAVALLGCGLLGQRERWGLIVDVQAEPGSITRIRLRCVTPRAPSTL